MAKRFEIIKPKSIADPAYADVEYVLRWIGADGADYLYLFYDAEFSESQSNDVINITDSNNIQSLIGVEKRSIKLTASDLSKNDLSVFAQMLRNKYVTRLKIDGTTERYAVDSNSFQFRPSELRYNLTFEIIPYSRPQWK